MEKEILQELIDLNLSQREIARKLGIAQISIRYWLKKYELKTNKLQYNEDYKFKNVCIKCKNLLNKDEFYTSKSGRIRHTCKNCANEAAHKKQKDTKIKMILHKGGKCENCKIELKDFHPSVFEFHHINPLIKDINFPSVKGWKWDRIEKELKNCKLLCANCHRMEHSKNLDLV